MREKITFSQTTTDMKKILIAFLYLQNAFMIQAQEVIPLYNDSIPNSRPAADKEKTAIGQDGILRISEVSRPSLTVFLPENQKSTGAAVVICPGGGYWILAAGHEGYDVARKFTQMGVTAFVLKYRIPSDQTMIQRAIGPLQDAQRAVQLVRERAAQWHLDPHQIGIMGFSAGGHLASTEGTHYDKPLIPNPQGTNLRPDFMILVYPVISFSDSIGHLGSRNQLLGPVQSKEQIQDYSNELQVNANTPPSFLVHAKDDQVVPVQNSIDFYDALLKNKVGAQIYLYDHGGHGFGMHNPTSKVEWMDLVRSWMKANGWVR